MSPNLKAFLDMLAWSEGTDNGRQPTKDHGYDVIVGGALFTDYKDHPRIRVYIPRIKDYSTAAGRYQLLARYYDAYRASLHLLDFSPASQDAIATQQIKERKALTLIESGDIGAAVNACSNIWASLPGNSYGQHMQAMEKLKEMFISKGGAVA